jgi:ATP-dependent Clp protease adaptor protein ClpS
MDLVRAGFRPAQGAEQVDTETRTMVRTALPWNVVVHDDPITPMAYVTKVFMEVFGYGEVKAQRLMLEVHHRGRSIVWGGPREAAELHCQKLQGRHLKASLEPGSAEE